MSQTSGPPLHALLPARRAGACVSTSGRVPFLVVVNCSALAVAAAPFMRTLDALTGFSLALVLLLAGLPVAAALGHTLLVPNKHIALLSIGCRTFLGGAMTRLICH